MFCLDFCVCICLCACMLFSPSLLTTLIRASGICGFMYFIIFGKVSSYILISCSLTFSWTPLAYMLVQLMVSYISEVYSHSFFLCVQSRREDLIDSPNQHPVLGTPNGCRF